jgi:topoisomerase IA-like protein
MSIEVMKQALEVLEQINQLSIGENAIALPGEIDGAMDNLRAAIEQGEKQTLKIDPAGCYIRVGEVSESLSVTRQWVELTDDEARALVNRATFGDKTNWQALVYMIDAKLKEKNAA